MTKLSTSQVAQRYAFSSSTLRRWRRSGKGPRFTTIRQGAYRKEYFYDLDDLLAWEREVDVQPVRNIP